MDNRPSFNGYQAELDAGLLDLYKAWTERMQELMTEEQAAETDWLDEFCDETRNRLVELRIQGKTSLSNRPGA